MKNKKEKILNYIHSLGISEAGVANDESGFSAFVCLFPYFSGYKDGANLSVYTYSEDYHILVKKYLTKIADYIKTQFPDVITTLCVDNHSGNDRQMAHAAGLGIIGENLLLINKKYGSYVFIGYVLTNLSFPLDTPLSGSCAKCGACYASCPGGMSNAFDISKCASHISQKKGELTKREQEILKKSGLVFGCDICQRVCPMNKNAALSHLPEFTENLKYTITHDEISHLSERQFKAEFGSRAFSWRGRKILERNLKILDCIKK